MNENKTKGEFFVDELLNGNFKKNHRPNHGSDFTGGLEDLYYYYFTKYMSFCICFLMDVRLKKGGYNG